MRKKWSGFWALGKSRRREEITERIPAAPEREKNPAATTEEERDNYSVGLSTFSIKFVYIFVMSFHLTSGIGRGKSPVDGAALHVAPVSPGQDGVWQRFVTNWARSSFRVRLPSIKANLSAVLSPFIYASTQTTTPWNNGLSEVTSSVIPPS